MGWSVSQLTVGGELGGPWTGAQCWTEWLNQVSPSCTLVLTIWAAVEIQAYSDASLPAPLHWDEADVSSQDSMLQLMTNNTLTVDVPLKCLKYTADTHIFIISEIYFFFFIWWKTVVQEVEWVVSWSQSRWWVICYLKISKLLTIFFIPNGHLRRHYCHWTTALPAASQYNFVQFFTQTALNG